eukprot:scaffold1776_cov108-Skeletonema_dohrnii-CCMP3373.AAC.1
MMRTKIGGTGGKDEETEGRGEGALEEERKKHRDLVDSTRHHFPTHLALRSPPRRHARGHTAASDRQPAALSLELHYITTT